MYGWGDGGSWYYIMLGIEQYKEYGSFKEPDSAPMVQKNNTQQSCRSQKQMLDESLFFVGKWLIGIHWGGRVCEWLID